MPRECLKWRDNKQIKSFFIHLLEKRLFYALFPYLTLSNKIHIKMSLLGNKIYKTPLSGEINPQEGARYRGDRYFKMSKAQ
jgi:hypothetical protein